MRKHTAMTGAEIPETIKRMETMPFCILLTITAIIKTIKATTSTLILIRIISFCLFSGPRNVGKNDFVSSKEYEFKNDDIDENDKILKKIRIRKIRITFNFEKS